MKTQPTLGRDNLHGLRSLAEARLGFISELAWSADGRILAAAYGEGIALWIGGFKSAPDQRLTTTAPTKSIAFSPDGLLLASVGADRMLRLWLVETGMLLYSVRGYGDSVNAVSFSPDGEKIASGGGDHQVHLFDMAETAVLMPLGTVRGEIDTLAFIGDGDRLAVGARDNTVWLWDIPSKRLIAQHVCNDWVRTLAVSPDGQTLYAGCKDGVLARIDAQNGDLIGVTPDVHANGVDTVAYSPDGSLLATGGRDGQLRLWDAADPTIPRWSGAAHARPLLTLAFHPLGGVLATAGGDNVVKLWGVEG